MMNVNDSTMQSGESDKDLMEDANDGVVVDFHRHMNIQEHPRDTERKHFLPTREDVKKYLRALLPVREREK